MTGVAQLPLTIKISAKLESYADELLIPAKFRYMYSHEVPTCSTLACQLTFIATIQLVYSGLECPHECDCLGLEERLRQDQQQV